MAQVHGPNGRARGVGAALIGSGEEVFADVVGAGPDCDGTAGRIAHDRLPAQGLARAVKIVHHACGGLVGLAFEGLDVDELAELSLVALQVGGYRLQARD